VLPLALIVGGTQWLSADTIESSPQRSIIASAIIFSLIAVVGVWQFVGTWRAGSKSKAPGRWWITRWMARAVALVGLALTAFVISTVPPAMARFYSEMNDTDYIGQQGHSLTVEGDQVIITGQLSWGLYDKFVQALRDDQVQTVVLNSNGGHYGVGRQMAVLINERARYADDRDVRQRLHVGLPRGPQPDTAERSAARVSRAFREHGSSADHRRSTHDRRAAGGERAGRFHPAHAGDTGGPGVVPDRRRVAAGKHRHRCNRVGDLKR
jgi:hypothetical protein